jgi:peptidoglycan/LPS O-acetylase OafA/YrhL
MPPILRYRPDIDGCRAIAILLVVGYHIGLSWLPGGFVGVDVFFVISGYLITSLLVTEQRDAGRIDFAAFYARRARRLLPALIVMIAVVVAAGMVVLLPDQQRALAASAVAGLLFSINLYFVHVHQGYFADQSNLVPLLHLWTLSVEEQFYLIWPVALAAVARKRDWLPARAIVALVAVISLASFAIGVALAGNHDNLAFLLLPGRAWQLGVGALLAFVPPISGRWATVTRAAGLVAIGAAGVVLGDGLPYPSFDALLPVIGAACLVVPAQRTGAVDRLLGARPVAGLGKLSYGWYLWHWPLLALARQLWEEDIAHNAAIALGALLIAAISYRWVERPFRDRRLWSATPRAALAAGGAATAMCAILAAASWKAASIPPAPGSILAQYLAARGGAARDFAFCDDPVLSARCVRGAAMPGPGIMLWGDSHAAQLSLGLERAARPAGAHVVMRTMGACSPAARDREAAGADLAARQCAAFNAAVRAEIPAFKQRWDLRVVLLAGSWATAGRGWEQRLAQVVADIRAAGPTVVLAQDLPLQPINYVTCAIHRPLIDCAIARDAVDAQAADADGTLRRIAARNPGTVLWSPRDMLCPDGRCVTVLRGRLLYRNRTHLTLNGAALLTPAFAPVVPRR